MIETQDNLENIARKKANKGSDWHVYIWDGRAIGGLVVTGCKTRIKTRGPNKGTLAYLTDKDRATVIVTKEDIENYE